MPFENPCPTCGSPSPHMHPAMQEGGEVQSCTDDYHRKITNQNTPKMIAESDRILSLSANG